MKKRKKEILIMILAIAIGFPLLWAIGKMNQQQKDLIETAGIETVGTVVQKSFGADNTGRQYFLKFDFFFEDTLVLGYIQFNNSYYFDKAIIGMKYKVRYIKDNPHKLKNSEIYIDLPILEEFENIEFERKRIRENYVNGEKFLEDARPIDVEREILGL
jgi:hypothetical protein